jgi:shikimate 5-dehydrogenase
MTYTPASQPTFYFIGVTTSKSSIIRVFPAWAEHFGLKGAVIKGMDFPLHADPAAYREAVAFIKRDPHSLGALVTTHKIDLFQACRDMFDVIDPHAASLHETSCISKRDGKLVCHAKDPISSGLAIDAFLPLGHFAATGAEALCIGAGGSTLAITWRLMQAARSPNFPSRIIVSDKDAHRLDEIRKIHATAPRSVEIDYVLADSPGANDALVSALKPGSLVINATGLGKDRPGSPLSDSAVFPEGGYVWELNYRGDLLFLKQARAQEAARRLTVMDGWVYFIHGWTQVISEVFDIAIPTSGPGFDAIARIASAAGKAS